jgi:HPt (histidine-containing phosphotransfer) domain-containing protein
MSRESEFLQRHKEDLRRAIELCRQLESNLAQMSLRGRPTRELMAICKRLEGSCRQMAHERGDDYTWLQLGHHYAQLQKLVLRLRTKEKWGQFGDLAKVFEVGIQKIDRLAETARGITSMSSSPLVILPKFLRGQGVPISPSGLILPH